MKIAYASSSCIPSRYANSINVMKMCQSFTRLGHDVELYVPDMPDAERDVDIFAYYGVAQKFFVKRLPAPTFPSFVGRTVYAGGYALSVSRTSPNIAYGRDWPALLMAARGGFPVVLELHAPAPRGGLKRLLFERLMRSDNLIRVVVNSEALKSDILAEFPQLKDRAHLARNGADPLPPDNGEAAPITRRDQMLLVGYIGHLYPGRGMEILGDFAEYCPWADFHIVGGWPEDVRFWKARLARNGNVFFHGHVPPSQVPSFLRIFDVLIAPYQPVVTLHGGLGDNAKWVCPLKLFDYMAAGKPIICSDHPVIREIVSHEKEALLCAPRDVAGWAEALRRLRDNRELRARVGANALERFTRNHSWDARALSVLDGLS